MKNLLISGNTLGRGNDEVGKITIQKFFINLASRKDLPEKIFFYNTGVLLCVPSSPVVDELRVLKEAGVKIFSCTTCVEFFKIEVAPFVEKSTMEDLLNILSGECIVL